MSVAFTNLSWWLWSGKHQEPRIPNGPSINSSADSNLWESDVLRFPLVQANVGSSSRKVKRKWHSRGRGRWIGNMMLFWFHLMVDVFLVPNLMILTGLLAG
uniref:Uncharacterized protein n=1 Tax=Glycine max TaxID=3847 RepID=C6TLP2_SOYBN|nr:unknown [Glycine max]